MTDNEVKKLNGFLSKTLKMEAEDMASLYNEAGELVSLTAAEKADTARVAKLKEDNDSQYKRGQKEVASKLEAKLKDKFEIESELTGVDLVEEILAKEIEKVKGQGAEDISAHPEYIKLKRETDKLLKAKDKDWQEKIDALQNEHTKQLMFSKVRDRAFAALDNLRPILPEDAKKAQKWKEKYIEEFKNYEFKEVEGEIAVLKDGKAFQDSHANNISFEELVKNTASEFFDFHTAEPRSSAGNKDKEQRQIAVPKNDDEYIAEMKRLGTTPENAEKRVKLMESYQTKTK